MTSVAVDPNVAFRFPRVQGDCTCPICVRSGADPSISTEYPSPFALYRLIKWDAIQQIDREPTDAEREEFYRLYPTMAFSRTAEGGGKLETPWVKVCLKLIRKLKKEKNAAAFNAPVDPVALNIPDYLKVIKHPMDLTTVENKLVATEARMEAADINTTMNMDEEAKEDVYTEPEEFASDVRMIWRNTFLYNKPEFAITIMAREMSIKFETGYAQL